MAIRVKEQSQELTWDRLIYGTFHFRFISLSFQCKIAIQAVKSSPGISYFLVQTIKKNCLGMDISLKAFLVFMPSTSNLNKIKFNQ